MERYFVLLENSFPYNGNVFCQQRRVWPLVGKEKDVQDGKDVQDAKEGEDWRADDPPSGEGRRF